MKVKMLLSMKENNINLIKDNIYPIVYNNDKLNMIYILDEQNTKVGFSKDIEGIIYKII